MKFFIAFLSMLALASLSFAAPITVSNQQTISTAGQVFNFSFTGLPTTGTNGQFSITLNGDYSSSNTESSVVTLDVASGNLDLGNQSLTNGIISHTITGLTLNSYSLTTFSGNDTEQTWVFDISDILLSTLLADAKLAVTVQNDAGVNIIAASNPDFVRVGFNFSSGTTIPEPASILFIGFGIISFFFSKSRS